MDLRLSELWYHMTSSGYSFPGDAQRIAARTKLSYLVPVKVLCADDENTNSDSMRRAAKRRGNVFLAVHGLRPVRFDSAIKTRGRYRRGLDSGYRAEIETKIQSADEYDECADFLRSIPLALGVKDELTELDNRFAHRCNLRCDILIANAGSLATRFDADRLEGARRNIIQRSIAVNEWPAAIAGIYSLAVMLRDRAYTEQGRFGEHIRTALDYAAGMKDLLVGNCYRRQWDRDLLHHIEFELIFLRIRLKSDIGERIPAAEIIRFRELADNLNSPRIRLDKLRGLSSDLIVEGQKLDEAAEFLTAAIWEYEHLELRSQFTSLSLLRWMSLWWKKSGRSFASGELSEAFANKFAQCPQAGIKMRFRRSVPAMLDRAKDFPVTTAAPSRFATRYFGMCNLPKLLRL